MVSAKTHLKYELVVDDIWDSVSKYISSDILNIQSNSFHLNVSSYVIRDYVYFLLISHRQNIRMVLYLVNTGQTKQQMSPIVNKQHHIRTGERHAGRSLQYVLQVALNAARFANEKISVLKIPHLLWQVRLNLSSIARRDRPSITFSRAPIPLSQ